MRRAQANLATHDDRIRSQRYTANKKLVARSQNEYQEERRERRARDNRREYDKEEYEMDQQ